MHTSTYFPMEDCHEIHKLGNLTLVFFFHWIFIVDSEFPPVCIENDGASVHTEAAAAAATCSHGTDRRRRFFKLGLLLRYGWPPPSGRQLLLPPSHCYSSTMLTWPWWWSCDFDVMIPAVQNIMVRLPALERSPPEWQNHIRYEFLRIQLSPFWQKKVILRMTNQGLIPALC